MIATPKRPDFRLSPAEARALDGLIAARPGLSGTQLSALALAELGRRYDPTTILRRRRRIEGRARAEKVAKYRRRPGDPKPPPIETRVIKRRMALRRLLDYRAREDTAEGRKALAAMAAREEAGRLARLAREGVA